MDVFLAAGVGQSIASGAQRGFKHFDTLAFLNGLEYTVGAIAEGRLFLGFGYRPYNLRADDVHEIAARVLGDSSGNTAAVFRVKIPLGATIEDGEDYKLSRFFTNTTSPFAEKVHWGLCTTRR